ncbi:MAG TPA: two-component regulator propeller domain-containing protein, partial [Cytophagales bacterium]
MAGAISLLRRCRALFFPLLLAVAAPLGAQQRPLRFEFSHLREPDGLSLRMVTCFVQDRDGFLWVGTSNGLYRFDGTHFAGFRQHRNQPHSLLNNQVYSVCEDGQGQIWAAFENGVSRYNKTTGRFRHITAVDGLPLGICKNILRDRAGTVWFTSRNRGLFGYFPGTGKVKHFPCSPTDSTEALRTLPNGLLEDPFRPGLWMSERHGLRYFDARQRQFTSHLDNPRRLPVFTANSVSALARDGDYLLIGDVTDRSILVYDLRGQRIVRRIRPNHPSDRNDFEPSIIVVDQRHNLWVSSWSAKAFYVDAQTGQVTNLSSPRAGLPTSLGSDMILAGWQHPDGAIWLGTADGITYTNPGRALYELYDLETSFPELSDERGIISFAEDPDGSWWLGTSIRGLLHYEPNTNALRVYRLPNATAQFP